MTEDESHEPGALPLLLIAVVGAVKPANSAASVVGWRRLLLLLVLFALLPLLLILRLLLTSLLPSSKLLPIGMPIDRMTRDILVSVSDSSSAVPSALLSLSLPPTLSSSLLEESESSSEELESSSLLSSRTF